MIWTPSGLVIYDILVGVPPGRFVFNSRMPRSIAIESSVNTRINEDGNVEEPSIFHNIYAQYQLHETTRFESEALVRRLSHDKYRFDIRTIGLEFIKSGWNARLGDTNLVGAEQGGLNLRGASVSYTTANNSTGRRYTFGLSGGMVNEQSFDYLQINDFFSDDSAVGGRVEINQKDFNLALGLNAYYDKEDNNWTALASIDEMWWPVKQVRIAGQGITFKGKNRANLNTYIDTDIVRARADYNFIQEGFTGFGVGQELPQEHNYHLYVTERIVPKFALYQRVNQAFSSYDTSVYSQNGKSLTLGGGFLFYLDKAHGRLGYSHYQSDTNISRNGQSQSSTARKEQWETTWNWYPKKHHDFRFEFFEAFEKNSVIANTSWDIINNLFLYYKWTPTDRFTLEYEIRTRFFPDFLTFNEASTQFSVIMYNKQWSVGSSLLFASYNGGENHESREELFAYRPLGDFFNVGFRTIFYQYFRQNQSVQNAQSIFFNLGVRVPLGRFKDPEREKFDDYLAEKKIDHKLVAVFDKNQSLSIEKGEKKLSDIEFMIEGKKYKTGTDGSVKFKSSNRTVTVELLSKSIPSGMDLLNPAMIIQVDMFEKETVYYFAESSNSLIIKSYAKNWDGSELPISGIKFEIYNANSNKLLGKTALDGGWGVAYVPADVQKVVVKVDLKAVSKKYIFDTEEKTVFITDGGNIETSFIARKLYNIVGKVAFKGFDKEELEKLRRKVYISLGKHKIQVGDNNKYYLEGVEAGKYQLTLHGIPSNMLSKESLLSIAVEVGGMSANIGLPELQAIVR